MPISHTTLHRLAAIIIVILAIAAGYFHNAYLSQKKRYIQIEDKYVRVRDMLGPEKTKELIQESYNK